jgi:radical SAM protein with 4Fe4S-binding SPASM domain
MAVLAQELGLRYRVDPLVTARLDGDCAPCDQRVEPELAVALEMGIERQSTAMAKFLERQQVSAELDATSPERMFRCGAGQASFHVDPVGFMHPCVMSPGIAFDTISAGFSEAWLAIRTAVDQATWGEGGRCASCPTALVCGYCPGLMVLEGVSPSEPPEYLCRLGECRLQSLGVNDPEVVGVTAG